MTQVVRAREFLYRHGAGIESGSAKASAELREYHAQCRRVTDEEYDSAKVSEMTSMRLRLYFPGESLMSSPVS